MKKIAVVNDISGFGRCSLSAALPVISALEVQCCPLVTGVFSAQTGYPDFYCTDLTDKMMPVINHWKKMGSEFDGILTGFISSAKQGEIILEMIDELKHENSLVVVDPVMGDDGKVYPCYNDESINVVKKLVKKADIITPNLSELCILAGKDFLVEDYSVNGIINKVIEYSGIVAREGQTVITTGIKLGENEIGTGIFKDGDLSMVETKRYGNSYSGTGDIFASIITAEAVKGTDIGKAVILASEFISECAKQTAEIPNYDRNDGIVFENKIKYLTERKMD